MLAGGPQDPALLGLDQRSAVPAEPCRPAAFTKFRHRGCRHAASVVWYA